MQDSLFDGPGEVRAICRSVDWSSTPLGPAAGWSASLRMMVRLCFECRTATALWLGPELTLIHNDAYAPTLNQKYPLALGQPLRAVWSEVIDQVLPLFERVQDGESIRFDEAKYRLLREGRETDAYFAYSLTPLRDLDGHIIGVFNVMEETTALVRARMDRERQYEEQVRLFEEANLQLREADRQKTHFLAVLSHELRNPLTPIKNSLYILDRVAPGSDPAKRAKAVIERQIDQLSHLVDDLLDVTRITRGKIQLQRRRLELGDLVRRTVDDHCALFQTAGVALEMEPASPPIFVDADWNRIAQVVSNLLQNSAKFTPRGGRVTVRVARDASAQHAVIRVADTGAGMGPELLARLFEPFMQADETLDRSKGGLGLGLALVKGLVELHGGTISATSDGPGCGSELTVTLPLDIRAPEAIDRAPAREAHARCRVLVIEDNVDAAASLKEILELQGHEVTVAYDGEEGLAAARTFRPELVLCDIGLPSMDGYEVARAIRGDESLRGTRLVAVSGYALPNDLQRAAEAGFEQHLAKPPSMEKLEAVLNRSPAR